MPVHLPVLFVRRYRDFFDQRFAVFVFVAQNRGGDFNQVGIQLGLVPFAENAVHFVVAQTKPSFMNW